MEHCKYVRRRPTQEDKDMVSACSGQSGHRSSLRRRNANPETILAASYLQLERMLPPERLASCNQQSENWAPIALRKKDAQPGRSTTLRDEAVAPSVTLNVRRHFHW